MVESVFSVIGLGGLSSWLDAWLFIVLHVRLLDGTGPCGSPPQHGLGGRLAGVACGSLGLHWIVTYV